VIRQMSLRQRPLDKWHRGFVDLTYKKKWHRATAFADTLYEQEHQLIINVVGLVLLSAELC
jgi:hypothetical protein